ncbi:hypothetical protein JIN80_16610, partial [Cerasicoccus arenae]
MPDGTVVVDETRTIKMDDDNIEIHPSSPEYFNIPISDATGPRYRKIALNGRPMSDERPQSASENDEAKEETYIDAFNLNLVHSVTDIYVPIEGSDLALSLRRNLHSEIFTENSGLRPSEDPAQPFGVCWSSNVSSYVKVVTPEGADVNQFEEPVKAYVIDENGNRQEFVKFGAGWFPLPSSSHEAKAYLTTLEETETHFIFRKKHGNALSFAKLTGGEQRLMRDRVEGSDSYETYEYARLESVTDRLGYQLVYSYEETDALIPYKIQAHRNGSVDSVGNVIGGLQIWLEQDGSNKVVRAWDPNGNAIAFAYDSSTISYDYTNASGQDASEFATVLETATHADNSFTQYGYEHVTEYDMVPRNAADTGPLPFLDPDPIPCNDDSQHIDYEHINLSSITDANSHVYRFSYGFDHSREAYIKNSVAQGYYVQTGSPRYVKQVQLPIGKSTFNLENNVLGKRMRINTQGSLGGANYEDVSITDAKTNTVINAEGFTTTYEFSGIEVEVLKQFRDLYVPGNLHKRFKDPRIIYYKTMTVDHGEFGSEIFTFQPSAGLALSSVTDLSGNKRNYYYSNIIDPNEDLSPAWPTIYGYYDDPTTEIRYASGLSSLSKYFTYDDDYRKMTSYRDPKGRLTLYNLDSLGRMTSLSENDGARTTSYAYGDSSFPGAITSQTVTSGTSSFSRTYTVDSQGRKATEAVGNEGIITSYKYDYNGNVRLVTDPKSYETSYEYDVRNRLKEIDFPIGSKSLSYDSRGNLLSETDENAHTTSYTYDALNRKTESRRPTGSSADIVTTYSYNDVNSLVSSSSSDGPTTNFTYDGLQRLTRTTVTGNNIGTLVTSFDYGANSGGGVFDVSGFKPTRSVDPRGNVTKVTYDGFYRPTNTVVNYIGGTASTSSVYDKVGNVTSTTDALGRVTSFYYDNLDNNTQIVFPDGTDVNYTYNAHSQVLTVTDEEDNVTETVYDSAARVTDIIQPGGITTSTDYDANGNVITLTNPLGRVWTYEYDERNRKTKETMPTTSSGTAIVEMDYDDVGNLTKVTDPRGTETVTTYDSANRALTVTDPFFARSMTYDAASNVLTTTVNGRTTATNTYDALGRLLSTSTSTIDDALITVTNAYDQAGNLVSVTDGKSQTTTFTYDGLNRELTRTYGGVDTTSMSYDPMRLISRTDANGTTTSYSYDLRDRLKVVSYSGAISENRTYSYDDVGNILDVTEAGKGGITNVAYLYDALYRITDETSNGVTNKYYYDAAGNRLQAVYAYGTAYARTLSSTYDTLNRTATITDGTDVTTYTYDISGNITDVELPNSEVITKSYDVINRIDTITGPGSAGSELYITANTYDSYGNLLTISESYPGGDLNARVITNGYDAANRLLTESIVEHNGNLLSDPVLKTVVTTYTYDNGHNRATKLVTENDGVTTTPLSDIAYTYSNTLNQLDSFSDSITGKSVTFDYDANGNRISRVADNDGVGGVDLSTRYQYDRENRLICLAESDGVAPTLGLIDIYPGADASQSAYKIQASYTIGAPDRVYEYVYDYRTRRVLRDESAAGGVSTKLVFSGGLSVQEFDGTATSPTVEYIRGSDYGGGIGGILYSLRSGTASFKHYNSRGDVVAATDASSSLTYQGAYEAFGRHGDTASSQESGTNPDRQQANTKDEDPTGLLNEGFRYRDLETGTFITRDPLGFVDGPNLYTYVVQ